MTTHPRRVPWTGRFAAWLRASRGGLFALAVAVGAGSGLGAVAFRYLIYFFTWLATGHSQFGQQGRVASAHLPFLGLAFFVLVPAAGGFLYGPVIYRWAREARGHGVPEVMIAVAENGGRIRPQVSVVKAAASALCMGVGGSVGREGPIVQIGSALASTLGQWTRLPENRLRILVACGAAGGISATFNAPITGLFFGVELILREFAIDSLFTVMLSAMLADVVGRAFLGGAPFLSGFPGGIELRHVTTYLLVAVLAVIAGLIGLGFAKAVYLAEDAWDALWRNRPEWARPGVGGIALGLLLLAVPQMYGVGYPVMYKAVAGGYPLWFLAVLALAKIAACSLTLGIGGSGGIFAPSLFIGVMSGYAFGDIVQHVFGAAAGQPALYAVVAMGAVFGSAARAPLTSVASVVEMTGDYVLTLPVMLAVAIASVISRALSYGTIYTTKLLRRGSDVDRSVPWRALQDLKVADVMRPLRVPLAVPPPHRDARAAGPAGTAGAAGAAAADAAAGRAGPDQAAADAAAGRTGPDQAAADWAAVAGPVTALREPQSLSATGSVAQALAQLAVYGRDGLPVLSADGGRVEGWVSSASVLRAIGRQVSGSAAEAAQAQLAAGWGHADRAPTPREPPAPLRGYRLVEVAIGADSPAAGTRLGAVRWPAGTAPVAVLRGHGYRAPDGSMTLRPGDRVSLLAPAAAVPRAAG
jgi:CIC family chloride channel protein